MACGLDQFGGCQPASLDGHVTNAIETDRDSREPCIYHICTNYIYKPQLGLYVYMYVCIYTHITNSNKDNVCVSYVRELTCPSIND